MAIENRNLAVGTRLVATYKKQAYVCTLEQEEGKPVFVLEDGKRYKSPSSAGSAVMGGSACNGWRFWSVAGEQPAAAPADLSDTPTSAPKPSPAPRAYKLIKRTPNQQGVSEGSTRWFCSACMNGFITEGAETPEICPKATGWTTRS